MLLDSWFTFIRKKRKSDLWNMLRVTTTRIASLSIFLILFQLHFHGVMTCQLPIFQRCARTSHHEHYPSRPGVACRFLKHLLQWATFCDRVEVSKGNMLKPAGFSVSPRRSIATRFLIHPLASDPSPIQWAVDKYHWLFQTGLMTACLKVNRRKSPVFYQNKVKSPLLLKWTERLTGRQNSPNQILLL